MASTSLSAAVLLISSIAVGYPSVLSGQQQVGVSLKLQGVIVPNNSLVDIDDLMYTAPYTDCCSEVPSNTNPRDEALQCVTDLIDCCTSPRTVRGDWYYPDGRRVELDPASSVTFRANRGPNEVRNGRRIYGSVRLFRRYSRPSERGRFRCELPSAADGPYVNQILYANIVNFGFGHTLDPVTISPSGFSIAGESYSLMCSATLFGPIPLPPTVPSPTFEWFFGPNDNASLPSGLTPRATVLSTSNSTSNTYTSTLWFSSLSQSHTGNYTCRLGARRLANTAIVTVNVPAISVQITTSGAPTLGQNGYSLTCGVIGAENLNSSITYQWTKNNDTHTHIQVGPTLSFSPLRLSNAGQYNCQATVSSFLLSNDITITVSRNIMFQVPPPSLAISSNISNPVRPIGSAVTLTCTVELSPLVDIPVTVNTVWTGPAEFFTTDTAQPVMGSITTYTSTAIVSKFGRYQSGIYICNASINPVPPFFVGSTMTGVARVTVGIHLSLKGTVYANNSVIQITEIGETLLFNKYNNTTSNTGLQCITDKIPCCRSPFTAGEWYFPSGEVVPIQHYVTTFYRNRGDATTGTVNLNRLNTGIISPIGLFCCEIPDANDVTERLCANIVFYSIVITPSAVGTPTAGDTYSLNCSISGTTNPAIYNWFASNGVKLTNISQLLFSSLMTSDAGLYTCRATVGHVVVEKTFAVNISLPAPTNVWVTPPVVPIIIGSSTNLTCIVELSPLVDVPVTVNTLWTGPAGFRIANTAQPIMGNSINYTSTAMISSSGREHSGDYTCKATVRVVTSFIDSVHVEYSSSRVIVVPKPIVTVHSDSPNHVLSGYSPALICTMEMTSVVNVPFMSVTTVWKGPDGTVVSPTVRPKMESLTLYTSSNHLTSVDSADSGEYTCTVSFKNGVMISASTNITIVDGMFQLKLKSVGICQQWYSESSDKSEWYSNLIKEALIKGVKHHCKCHFPITNLLNEDNFICEDSPNSMIYRNTLLGTLNFNGTQIVDFIQDWVSTGPLIKIDGNSVRVDSSCPVAISSLDEPTCGKEKYDDPKYAICAQHLDDNNIANCFEGCVFRNG